MTAITVTHGSPGTAASSEPVVAVIRQSGALELYGVRDGQTAHRLRTLHGPAGMAASAVTPLSGGARPTVCELWRGSKANSLECYGWGSDSGTVVAGTGTLGYADIALSYTGRSLASVGGRLLATQLGFDSDGRELTRAVEIDVATGRVVSVVSVAAEGRRMSSVSGGGGGVLYRTEGYDGGLRTYWRAPGKAHGRPLAGIPADASGLVAQP